MTNSEAPGTADRSMEGAEEPLFLSDGEAEAGNGQAENIELEKPMPELTDLSHLETPKIKEEANIMPFSCGDLKDHIIEVSDSGNEESVAAGSQNVAANAKKESEVVDLSLDKDDDLFILDNGKTAALVKQEPRDTGRFFDWTPMNVDEIDLEAVPKEVLLANGRKVIRRQLSPKEMKRLSQIYAQKALKQRRSTGAKTPTLEHDGFEWMSSEIIPDEIDTGLEFQRLKKEYKIKKMHQKNTLEDDIQFKKAEIKDNERNKRLAHDEASDSSDATETEESDDGRCPLPDSYQGLFKRLVDDFDNDDDDDVLQDPEKTPPPPTKQARQTNANNNINHRSRARLYKKEFKIEESYNKQAGIEAVLIRDQLRQAAKAQREAEKQEGKGVKRKRKKNAPKSQLTGKRTKTGRMTNLQSLINGNVFENSSASIDAALLPEVPKQKKVEFLSSLIANIPEEKVGEKHQAEQDQNDILRSTRILMPRGVTPNEEGKWSMKGMKSSLYHHQVQGAACMKHRELSDKGPFGGILADSMGLGKTVITIAAMVANRQKNPEEPKCTLIVCSPALIQQWEREIETHADPNVFQVINRFYGSESSKTRRKGAEYQMESADILFTTYGEVVRSYPKRTLPKDIKATDAKLKWWENEWNVNRGFLHRAHFYRVVLDEAQVIKNHKSHTSIACRALMARHRWAISGTPIQNRLDELFPYFKFLRVRHTGSIGTFRQNFCLKDSDVCNKRLVSMVSGMMIRRSHDTVLLGHKLLNLPKIHQKTITVHLNTIERYIYSAIKARCIRAINAAIKEGELEREKRMVMMMFQRLRQMVAHIFMVQEVIEKDMNLVSWENIWFKQTGLSEIQDPMGLERAMMTRLEQMIAEKDQATIEPEVSRLFSDSEERDEELAAEPKVKVPKSTKTLIISFGKHLRDMKRKSMWSELREKTFCQFCGGIAEDPHVTSCYHLYCKGCLQMLAIEAAQKDLDQAKCHKCGLTFQESAQCSGLKELEAIDLGASGFPESERQSNDPGTKRDFNLTTKYIDRNDEILLSSKIIAVKEEIAKSLEENPDQKIIVFTEWLMVMHLVGRVCQKEGWKHCHYNGGISHSKREQALCAFSNDASFKVLVASLKCGGTGLNLTAASKVICVDLWFNRCVEEQAFCRVHRIGQTKETYITRIVAANTVDEDLIKMQEDKKEIIGAALDDRSAVASMTIKELMSLFGTVAYDENSRPFIMVDDDEMLVENKKKKSKNAATNEGAEAGGGDIMEDA